MCTSSDNQGSAQSARRAVVTTTPFHTNHPPDPRVWRKATTLHSQGDPHRHAVSFVLKVTVTDSKFDN